MKENGTLKFWNKGKIILTTISLAIGILGSIWAFSIFILKPIIQEEADKRIELQLKPIAEKIQANKETLEKIFEIVMKWGK